MSFVSWHRVLANIVAYVASVLACEYALQFAASQLAKIIFWLRFPFTQIDSLDVVRFYTGNWLIFNLIAGLAFGAFVYSMWKTSANALVWVPLFCLLLHAILMHPNSVFVVSSVARASSSIFYFLSAGCSEVSDIYISQRCTEQLEYSVPFYGAVGFSAGTLLCMLYQKRERLLVYFPATDVSDDSSEPVNDHNQSPNEHGAST